VLSAVLIMVAFLAILSGALMTELSTNFLLSNDLVNRVKTEATVNSAAELALNQLQTTPLNNPCPGPATTPPLNGQRAVASIVSCAAVIDRLSLQRAPAFRTIASSNPFQVNGTHVVLPGLDEYVVGDSGGTVLDYRWGQVNPRWTLRLGGSVTGQPLVMPDPGNFGEYLDLIPLSGPSCGGVSFCLSVRSDDLSGTPQPFCVMATTGVVRSQPAVGQIFQSYVFIGDSGPTGNVYLVDPTQSQDNNGPCSVAASQQAGAPVVAGPVVVPCSCGNRDWVFVLTSGGGSTNLVRFGAGASQNLSPAVNFNLFPPSWGRASGIAIAPGRPGRFVISFAGGIVAVVQINAAGNPTLTAYSSLSGGASGPPYWCSCNLIGVGTGNGSLYVLDTSLNILATYSGGSAIRTAPAADGAGNWYFAADDGVLYEVQKPAGGITMVKAASFGAANALFRSSPLLSPCQPDICVYIASTDARAYLVDLDARAAVLAACITTAPPTCSPGANPRVWTRVEVGVVGNTQAMHVQGWSYYSP
jgi:hypothetical protein